MQIAVFAALVQVTSSPITPDLAPVAHLQLVQVDQAVCVEPILKSSVTLLLASCELKNETRQNLSYGMNKFCYST